MTGRSEDNKYSFHGSVDRVKKQRPDTEVTPPSLGSTQYTTPDFLHLMSTKATPPLLAYMKPHPF